MVRLADSPANTDQFVKTSGRFDQMDDLDRRLLELLGANSRSSVTQLARELGVARATVQDRMHRL